jgi:hypothetical protein
MPICAKSGKNKVQLVIINCIILCIALIITGNGRDSLSKMVHENKEEYYKLTAEEKELLVKEFDAEKPSAPVPRLTNRAKVNDAKHTINHVEQEV